MADEAKKGYPNIPVKHWWSLRDRFKSSIPSRVTANYVASALDMGEQSATANILPSLRAAGIIDGDGKPTDLAVKWRDDKQYAKVCEQIRKQLYPSELIDLAPNGDSDRDEVERWFANHTGSGQAAVRRMTAIYQVLSEGDPSKAKEVTASRNGDKGSKPAATKPRKATQKRQEEPAPAETKPRVQTEVVKSAPSLHFNVQIHISPEATSEQIEQIFASMGKHLKQLSS